MHLPYEIMFQYMVESFVRDGTTAIST